MLCSDLTEIKTFIKSRKGFGYLYCNGDITIEKAGQVDKPF